ncbi:spore germination protein [Paenibacillus sp. CC-CFT747]|nr:spore germination protein [Paenibacillus sp. CC-CFT747]
MLLAGLACEVNILVIWALMRRYPDCNVYQILPQLLGKRAGKVLTVLYAAYYLVFASTYISFYTRTIRTWILPTTPRWVVIFLLIAIVYCIAREKTKTIARLFLLLSPLILTPVILDLFTLRYAHPLYLLPVGVTGWKELLKGGEESLTILYGYDMMFFIYARTRGSDKAKLYYALVGTAGVCLLYTYTFVMSAMFFSPMELPLVPEPALYMLKEITFKIVERTDLLFLSVWIIMAITSAVSYLYGSSLGGAELWKGRSRRKLMLPLAVVSFLIPIYLNDEWKLQAWNKVISKCSPFVTFFIPLILLAVSRFAKKNQGG